MTDAAPPAPALNVRWLGQVDYVPTQDAMVAFTDARHETTPDELWICEHPPVYTQGISGRAEHVHDAGGIPVVHTRRGGQVTYHGPGQIVAYPLIDLKRLGIYVKEYVYRLEQATIATLEALGVTGHRVASAPGIYVRLDDPSGHAAWPARPQRGATAFDASHAFAGLGKIAALGIKVTRHCAYHGLALNVCMDLSPYTRIDPCGYAGLKTVDLATLGVRAEPAAVAQVLVARLAARLSP